MLGEKGGNYKGLEKGQGWMIWVLTDGACKVGWGGGKRGVREVEERGKRRKERELLI